MPSDAELVGRLFLALLLGGIVGLERELTGQTAGLRTSMTVALGAALFGIVSAYSYGEFVGPREETTYQVDVTRVASNVVVGVGFLGGGTIIKHGASVRGLTTAATLWVTAAIGLGVGLGVYVSSIAATVALVFALSVLRGPRRWLRRVAAGKDTVMLRLALGADPGAVVRALYDLGGIDVGSLSIQTDDGATIVQAHLRGTGLEARVAELAGRDDIVEIDFTS